MPLIYNTNIVRQGDGNPNNTKMQVLTKEPKKRHVNNVSTARVFFLGSAVFGFRALDYPLNRVCALYLIYRFCFHAIIFLRVDRIYS